MIEFKKRPFNFTKTQQKLLTSLLDDQTRITIINGVAGSSKTYMAIYAALQLLNNNPELELLYVRSVAESAERHLGSLPGDIAQKFDPFLIPLFDKLEEIVHDSDRVHLKASGRVDAIPINYLRGANWINKVVVADEAQNMSYKELTTLMTRMSSQTRLVIIGDTMQSDINGKSGFQKLCKLFDDNDSRDNGISVFTLDEQDIVRDPLLKFIVEKLRSYTKI